MKAIINAYTKEIEFVSYHAEFAESNINIGGTFIAGADRYEIYDISSSDIPVDFKPNKYRLINGSFKKSDTYKEDNAETEIQSLKDLTASQELKLQEQDSVINDLLVSLLMF